MKKKFPLIGRERDWAPIRAEFIAGNETPNAFRLRKKLPMSAFYNRVKQWQEERDRMREQSMARLKRNLKKEYDATWEEYTDILKSIRKQVKKILRMSVDENGEVIKPISPANLRAIATSIETALKSDKLLSGSATEIKKIEGGNNLHVHVVEIVEALKNDPSSIDIGELVETSSGNNFIEDMANDEPLQNPGQKQETRKLKTEPNPIPDDGIDNGEVEPSGVLS